MTCAAPFALLFAACAQVPAVAGQNPPHPYSDTPGASRSGTGWSTADPAKLGLDTVALKEHLHICRSSGADACFVAYRGVIVQEWYGPEYAFPMPTMSSVKSWTGLLVGMLIADGKIKSLDQPVADFVPEWTAGARAGVTVRQLLTMTSGLGRRSATSGADMSVGFVSNKDSFVVTLPLQWQPGSRWEYSNEGAQLLSPLLDRAAGIPSQQYAKERLFGPLGMDSTELRLDQAGHAWTYADAKTTLRDFARIGQLMLNRGRWNGRQIVPEAWIAASTHPVPQRSDYGMLWWILGNPPVGFATIGYLDTDCLVFPREQLVVARMQAKPREGEGQYLQPHTVEVLRSIVPPALQGAPASGGS